MNKRLPHLLNAIGLLRPAYRAREWMRARSFEAAPALAQDGQAIPGRLAMVRVVGHADWQAFLATGRDALRMFADLAEAAGKPLAQASAVLDWGCGCGRLARHIPSLTQARVVGRDVDAYNIRWAQAHLKGDFGVCGLAPPLDLPDASIDVMYALSVLTHLSAGMQAAWLAELARVVKPGGVAMLTFHDPQHPRAPKDAAADLLAKGFVQTTALLEGANYTASFQTPDHLKSLAEPWFDLAAARTSAETPFTQAVAVFVRR